MADLLVYAIRHDAWATRTLIAVCRTLDATQLAATAPGGYGTIPVTLRHILGAEAYYHYLLVGKFPHWDWRDDVTPSFDEMDAWAREMAAFWESFFETPRDPDEPIVRHEAGGTRRTRLGVVVAQALHHGNAHREQVCAVLTHLGIEPPELDPLDADFV